MDYEVCNANLVVIGSIKTSPSVTINQQQQGIESIIETITRQS